MDYPELDIDRLSSEALGTSLNRRNAILEMLLKKGYIVFRGTYFTPPLKTDSEFGAAFVLKENNLITTTFSSKEYESDVEEMMEVYRQYAKSK